MFCEKEGRLQKCYVIERNLNHKKGKIDHFHQPHPVCMYFLLVEMVSQLVGIVLDTVFTDARVLCGLVVTGHGLGTRRVGVQVPLSAPNFLAENNHNHVYCIHACSRGFNVRRFREFS